MAAAVAATMIAVVAVAAAVVATAATKLQQGRGEGIPPFPLHKPENANLQNWGLAFFYSGCEAVSHFSAWHKVSSKQYQSCAPLNS